MPVFLPLLDEQAGDLIEALARIVPVVVSPSNISNLSQNVQCFVTLENSPDIDVHLILSWLNKGVEKIIVPLNLAKDLIAAGLPSGRLSLLLDVGNVSAVTDTVRNGVSGVFLKTPVIDIDLVSSVSKFFTHSSIYVLSGASLPPTASNIRELLAIKAIPVIPASQLTLSPTTANRINIADAFLAPVVSDRPDGLFPTVITSETGHSLGLVYSSAESVSESIITGKGVYQSRKHGLWRKGETSGATQEVVHISLDCDSDSLEFRVRQHGAGFCHLNRQSCFSEISGLPALESTLRSRLASAPEGSYTRRLFDDPSLLQSKIMEEADELCRAVDKKDVAFEAADLLYFALTKCVQAGVGIKEIEESLDLKAKRITRRPGNAKPQWVKTPAAEPTPPQVEMSKTDGVIRMRTADLAGITADARAELLRRPVLKSDQMMLKVKPIIDDVRVRGDVALLELTANFDKAQLTSTVVLPPFAPGTMEIDPDVRAAIDQAYLNIRKFHEAQMDKEKLVVETMPGVVCARFARPIARVGLYVPGGTAILPSTALMLGIPAQVAGCKEIVLATPPRADGSISPEVMYVAHRVGASAILKAGGAQAVAAMAYGTKSVPKVDKIFGPGNQWVTAAKMLVQNDTDALVSIDMPAGPSEVLVIADHTANPAFVAADLLSQAEHGVDSQVILVAVSLTAEKLVEIEREVDVQAKALSRVDIVRESIPKSIIVKASSVEEAIAFSNDYAPEHLILHLENAPDRVASIDNAGSVFVGPFTPESCGDYASGTNHTLPTNGYARQFSGVNTQSFQKHITSQQITPDGLKGLGPIVATLADCEGLQAHANAVRIRLVSRYACYCLRISTANNGLGLSLSSTLSWHLPANLLSLGIGLAVTKLLLKNFHAQVVALSRTQTPELIALSSDDLLILSANESSINHAITRAEQTYKHIDGLVLNAGILEPLGPIGGDSPLSAWKNHFDVNFFSLVTVLKVGLPALRKSELGGRVVFVSSGAAVKGSVGWGPYSAGKAAMNSLCRTMAEEEPTIVSVALRPGMVDTGMQATLRTKGSSFLAEKDHKKFVKAHREGKLVQPEDAGHVIAALALQAQPALSGQFVSWDSEECRPYRAE
ncbi:hypothetical protein C0995_002870 [Termitomyces sp. Mi166|nr:hypothetical protein C0995_002870 [Termitomyces sp. Mi166\